MKYLILTLLIFIGVNPICAQKKQNYNFSSRIIYRLSYQPDSNDVKSVLQENMELLLNDSVSLFRAVNKGAIDSAYNVALQKGNMTGPDISFLLNHRTRIFYNIFKKQGMTMVEDYKMESYGSPLLFYKESQSDLDWKIQPDTATINGFLCQRASLAYGGRNWVAWFTPDIAISDGPYIFSGLPGLILSIADTQHHWEFNLIGIQPKASKKVVHNYDNRHPSNSVTKIEFYKSKKYVRDNIFQLKLALGDFNGVLPDVLEGQKKWYKERANKDNNWIELNQDL